MAEEQAEQTPEAAETTLENLDEAMGIACLPADECTALEGTGDATFGCEDRTLMCCVLPPSDG